MSANDPSNVILSVHTGCDIDPVSGKRIVLKERRWFKHINAGHVETVDRLHDVEYTLRSPHYVAACIDGPGGKNSGGLCFVRRDATPSSAIAGHSITLPGRGHNKQSYLHVMVQCDSDGPYVATALFADGHHKDVQWVNPAPGAVDGNADDVLKANYDSEADILYLHVGEPVAAYSDTGADGLILRYALEDDRACGVTVMSYHDWADYQDTLATHVAAFLHIENAVARRTLNQIK